MHAQPVAEIRDIVIPAFARIVGHMEGDATVDAHDEELQVVAQTETRPEGEVLQEAAPLHLPARAARVVVDRPDIPGIEEGGSVQIAEDGEAVLEVGFQLQVAGLVDVAILVGSVGDEASGADAADGKCADAVGAADVELLVVGRRVVLRVAVAVDDTRHESADEVVPLLELVVIADFRRELDKLGEGIAEQLFALDIEALPGDGIPGGEDISGLRERGLPPDVVPAVGQRRVVVGIGIRHRGDELVLEAEPEGAVGADDGVELGRRFLQFVICQLEGDDGMVARRAGLELQSRATSERQHLEELRAVHLVGIDAEGGARGIQCLAVQVAGEEQLREREGAAESQLVAVHHRGGAVHAVARLPLVRAFELHAEGFAPAENVVLRNAEDGTGAGLVVALGRYVQFQLAIEGQVIRGIDAELQCVAARGRILRGKLQFGIAEDAEAREGSLRALLAGGGETLAGVQMQSPVEGGGADAQFAFVVEREVAVANGIRRRLVVVAIQIDRNVANPPGAQRLAGHTGRKPEAEIHVFGPSDRVRLIDDVIGAEIVISVVAEEGGDALTLGLEYRYVEIIPLLQERLEAALSDNRIRAVAPANQADAVEGIGFAHSDVVADTGLLRVFLVGNQLEIRLTPEIPVFLQ